MDKWQFEHRMYLRPGFLYQCQGRQRMPDAVRNVGIRVTRELLFLLDADIQVHRAVVDCLFHGGTLWKLL